MARAPLAAPLLAALVTLAPAAHAAWIPNGTPVAPSPAHQSWPVVASDGAGGAFIAFTDGRNGAPTPMPWSRETDIYLQHLTPNGDPAPGWPADGLPVCTAPGYQASNGALEIAADGAGGAIVLWGDSRANPGSGDLYAQRITAAGTIAPGWPVDGLAVCAAPDWQDEAQLAPDGAGGAFFVWRDQRKGSSYDHDTYAQHLTGAGALAAGWPVDGLALDATAVGTEDCTLLADGAGGAYFAYTRDAAGTAIQYSLIVKRLDGAGAPAAGWPVAGVIACGAAGARIHPRFAPDGAGGVIAAWADTRSDVSGDLYAAHVSAAGVVDPAWPADGRAIAVAPAYQGPPELVSDLAGGAIVGWSDYRSGGSRIYAQHVLAGGVIAPGWPASGLLVCLQPAASLFGGIASDGLGGAYFAYMATDGVAAIRLAPWGLPAPGWLDIGANLDTLSTSVVDPRIAATPGGGAIVTWPADRGPVTDPYSPPNPYRILATRIGADGPVPALASLASATCDGRVARIEWQVRGVAVSAATVERREGEGEWSVLGAATAGSDDRWSFEDATVEPGRTYAYRLGFTADGALAYAPEAVVVVPALSLAIGRIAPVRGAGAIELSVTLASGAPASLELFDVAGRRLASRELGALGAGTHVVRIERPGVASGLLLARLRQGAACVTGRAMVVR